jgi:hypothetical protein
MNVSFRNQAQYNSTTNKNIYIFCIQYAGWRTPKAVITQSKVLNTDSDYSTRLLPLSHPDHIAIRFLAYHFLFLNPQ